MGWKIWGRSAANGREGGAAFLSALVEKRTSRLRKLGGSRAGEARFGRFPHNPAVTKEEMLATAGMAAGARVGGRRVLVLQDTTELNVVVDALTGGLIGLAGAGILNRTERPTRARRRRPLRERESRRWLEGAETAGRVLAEALEITVVADREGDIHEEFARRPANAHLPTRAARDRAVAGGGRLFAVGFGAVSIPRPGNGADPRLPDSVPLHGVDVREIDPPAGEKPVRWCLLATHAVADLADGPRIVGRYRRRWIVEQVFRALKGQGPAIEESQILDPETLAKLATAALIAAVRVMRLVHARDGTTGRTLADAFQTEDGPLIEALVAELEGKTEKQKNPHPPGTLARAARVIGRPGGWNGSVGGGYKPAGPKTMHDGLLRFDAIKHGWELAQDA